MEEGTYTGTLGMALATGSGGEAVTGGGGGVVVVEMGSGAGEEAGRENQNIYLGGRFHRPVGEITVTSPRPRIPSPSCHSSADRLWE